MVFGYFRFLATCKLEISEKKKETEAILTEKGLEGGSSVTSGNCDDFEELTWICESIRDKLILRFLEKC